MSSHAKLLAIETPNLHQNSCGRSVRSWESNKISLPLITPEWTVNQNTPINGWRLIFTSLSTTGKMTGSGTYPWQSLHTTIPLQTTGESLFQLLMGYHPRADWDKAISTLPQVLTHLDHLQEVQRQAQLAMTQAQNQWIKPKTTLQYQVGDLVWLEGHNLQTSQPTVKPAP